MRSVLVSVICAVVVLALGGAAMADISTTPSRQPALFVIRAKVVQVGRGWVQVVVTQVQPGSTVRANATLRILETAKTKYLRAGKAASGKDLRSGEMVQIRGSIMGSGKALTYQADGVTILK